MARKIQISIGLFPKELERLEKVLDRKEGGDRHSISSKAREILMKGVSEIEESDKKKKEEIG